MTGDRPERFERLFHEAPCALFTLDPLGRFLEVNRTLGDWLGTEPDRLAGTRFADALVPSSRILHDTRVQPVLTVGGRVDEVLLQLASADGVVRPALLTARRETGTDITHAALIDATQRTGFESELVIARRSAEASADALESLRTSAERFLASSSQEELLQALAQTFTTTFRPSEVAVLTPAGDDRWLTGDGRLVPPWRPDATVVVRTPEQLAPDTADVVRGALRHPERLAQVVITPLVSEEAVAAVVLCVFHRARELDDRELRLRESIVQNATVALARIRLQGRLARSAQEDPLTGLLNRATLRGHLESAAAFGRFGILFLDLDGFKTINDVHGHVAGDAVLVETAARLRSAVRDRDVVARWGGDEFVIVCFGVDDAELRAVAERIAQAVAAPAPHPVTTSIGAVVVREDSGRSADVLLALADSAMYRAKQAGPGRVSVALA